MLRISTFRACLCISTLLSVCVQADQIPIVRAHSESDRVVLQQLTRLEGRFVDRIRYEGYSPRLAEPKIVLGDPNSYGDYQLGPNTIVIASWSRLSREEHEHFEAIAKGLGPGVSGREVFNNGTHRWVFVHELGHWWQACQQVSLVTSYALEMGADRIALAFWRHEDAYFTDRMILGFKYVQQSIPDPVPAGQDKAAYFDKNQENFDGAETYPWFQSDMVVTLAAENPPPSLLFALAQPLYRGRK